MKKIILYIFFGANVLISTAQNFNIQAEARFLQIINKQHRKYLIRSNIPNAELIADSLFYHPKQYNKQYASAFFIHLAESYLILKKYEFAYFSLLRFIFLYPDNKYLDLAKEIFSLSYQHKKHFCTIDDSIFESLIKKSSDTSLSLKQRQELLLKNAIFCADKQLYGLIDYYITMYQYQYSNTSLPMWLGQWRILYHLHFGSKKIIKNINFSDNSEYKNTEKLLTSFNTIMQRKISRRMRLYYPFLRE